jgi:hypothetical protein
MRLYAESSKIVYVLTRPLSNYWLPVNRYENRIYSKLVSMQWSTKNGPEIRLSKKKTTSMNSILASLVYMTNAIRHDLPP